MEECEVSRLPTAMLVSSLLHSLSVPSQFPTCADTKAELVRKFYQKSWSEPAGPPEVALVSVADCDVTGALVSVAVCEVTGALATVRLCRDLSRSSEDRERWLAGLAPDPTEYQTFLSETAGW